MIGLFQIPPSGVAFISKFDPALNAEAVEWGEYIRTFDIKYLPTHPGTVPTKFYLRRLSLKQWNAVRAQPAHLQDNAAVSYGVVSVDGFVKANGSPLAVCMVGTGEEQRLDYDTLAAMYTPHLFAELSTIIMVLSGLDPLVSAR